MEEKKSKSAATGRESKVKLEVSDCDGGEKEYDEEAESESESEDEGRRKGEILRVVLCLTCGRRKINEDEEDEEEGDGGEREEGNHWVPPSYRHPLAQGKELIRLIHAQPREAGPPLCFWVIFETRYTPVPPAKYLSCFSTWNHPWKEENHDFFKIFTLCPLNYYEFS
ncbi:hypothetical protein HZH66_013608 [Vespula vulgaris]|uniref:Uncharacterized protein n=1 Tax=Vespula vulgaris TaxID=7454 RepID=A0A834J582_VESVU|nr:hypothetical protein HZH66_013608 [Vespula vulgaris]